MDQIPPADADDWSDEEWLTWLEETDLEGDGDGPRPAGARRERSIGSQLLIAGMLGLHDAIYGTRPDEVAIVIEADGQPDEPESLEVHLEPDHPEDSTVVVRPWLLDLGPAGSGHADGGDPIT